MQIPGQGTRTLTQWIHIGSTKSSVHPYCPLLDKVGVSKNFIFYLKKLSVLLTSISSLNCTYRLL